METRPEPTILHVAIDSFPIHAERLRCPKLEGRPIALAPGDSPRPRIVLASREARAQGVEPGTPLLVARRLCRDLIALPPDPDLYSGLSDSIRERLAPFGPLAEWDLFLRRTAGFALDLTGVTRSHRDARNRAAAAGREVERAFRIHPTLGLGATRLVSRVAASILAPDGELLDIVPGTELEFLAPLAVRVLPSARHRRVAARLDTLNLRAVGDVQALSPLALRAAFGRAAGTSLWREARGIDGAPRRASPLPMAAAEETLSDETNDRSVLGARLSRLMMELTAGLAARRMIPARLAVSVRYADSREGRAERTLPHRPQSARELRETAQELLDRATSRRIRVRRIRVEALERDLGPLQLTLWGCAPQATRRDELDRALDTLRARLGSRAVVPASWMLLGLVHPSPRP
jgi:DNA polymerase IV